MMRRPYLPMAPASFITALAVAFFLAPAVAAAGPVLSGSFQVDSATSVELATEGERLTGVAGEGWACRLDAKRQVLEGTFEGMVFVGRLTVCQKGDTCAEAVQTYPVLAFFNEADRALVAHVRLREGCQSSVVKEGRFILQPAGSAPVAEAPSQASPTPASATPTSGITSAASGSTNASAIANKRGQKNPDIARLASDEGMKLYLNQQYVQAAHQFDISIFHDSGDKNWSAYMGRGSSRYMLGQIKEAITDLEKSRRFNARVVAPSQRDPGLLYTLGCAYAKNNEKKKAIKVLSEAVQLNYALHASVEVDVFADLKNLLGDMPEFQELVKKSREKVAQPRGTTAGPGTQKP